MLDDTQSYVEEQSLDGNSDNDPPPLWPVKSPPQRFSLRQVYSHIARGFMCQSKESQRQNILILNSYLKHSENRILREDGDDEYIDKIMLYVSRLTLPDGSIPNENDNTDVSSSTSNTHSFEHIRKLAISCFEAISTLQNSYTIPRPDLPLNTLVALLAYTSPRDPWTSNTSLMLSKQLLDNYTHQTSSPTFIIGTILKDTIRPRFSASKPTAITPAGRKAMPSSAPPKRFESEDVERKTKPWMYEAPWAAAVFEWAVRNINTESIPDALPLLLPPLMSLLDAPLTLYRSRGLYILVTLLPNFRSKLLQQTGLGEVFEDAIMPTLLYLPSLTPVEESVQLLLAAYDALFALAEVRFEGIAAGRMKFWDRVIRKGILMGYEHAMEHPRIVEILIRVTGKIMDAMGIHAVKHLKSILPILFDPLTSPFSPSTPSLLHTTLLTLRTIILTCWPRIQTTPHRLEIIKALVICWRTLERDTSIHTPEDQFKLSEVKQEMKEVGRVFVTAVKGGCGGDIFEEIEEIVEVDETGVGEVFGLYI